MMQTAILESAGCAVLGPAPGVGRALLTIAEKCIDLALLDVNLGDTNGGLIGAANNFPSRTKVRDDFER